MKVLVCDACKRVLEEEIRDGAGDFHRHFDLCVECKEKFKKIYNKFNEEWDELDKERDNLYEKYKEKLKEIGIDYDV